MIKNTLTMNDVEKQAFPALKLEQLPLQVWEAAPSVFLMLELIFFFLMQ